MGSRGDDEDKDLILSSLSELDEYLSSSVIFWRMQESNLPLSPGNLLFALRRIGAEPELKYLQTSEELFFLIQKHRAAWEKKIHAEIPVRLQQWKNIIEDVQDAGGLDASYRYSARVRVILDLLINGISQVDAGLKAQLQQLDETLSQLTIPGQFIWKDSLADQFPQDRFYYLYVRLKGEGE